MRKKFKIYYAADNIDKSKAGTRYKPISKEMLVMNSAGIFFVYIGEAYYPSIVSLVSRIGNYDVEWVDALDSDGDDREIRLFDSQWVNIVNTNDCWEGYTKEEAVNAAVKMTEEAMAKNMKGNSWPDARSTHSKEGETTLSIMLLPL